MMGNHKRRIFGATAVVSVLALTTTVVANIPAAFAAGSDVSVDWKITEDWGSGFQGAVTVRNNTNSPIASWKLTVPYGNTISDVWDATSTAANGIYIFSGPSWGNTIAPQSTASFGFIGAPKNSSPLRPTTCSVAGLSCEITGATAPTSPEVTPTPTPTASASEPTSTPTPTPITGAPGSTVVAPYVDMGLWPTADLNAMSAATGVKAFTAAFIVQEASKACSPAWGGYSEYLVGGSGDFKDTLTAFQNNGGRVIASFGGAAGSELAENCTSDADLQAAYQKVVNRYSLNRIDFDIEGSAIANSASNQRRAKAVAGLQAAEAAKGNNLEVSLTVPVMPDGMDYNGLRTVKEFAAAGVNISQVNLMTMDYGNSYTDMGTHAITAAQGTAAQLKTIPQYASLTNAQLLNKIGVTPMIGQNDVASEVFTISDTAKVAKFALDNGVGFVGWWEMTRDKPCTSSSTALYLCTKTSNPQWAFSKEFVVGLGGTAVVAPVVTPTPTLTPTPIETATVTPAANGVNVAVKVTSDWGSGRNVDLKITNTGTAPITNWTVSLPWKGTGVTMWNATFTLTNGVMTVNNLGWNGTIAPGATTTIGFGESGTFAAPATCTFNGGSCAVEGSAVTTTPTATPTPTPTPTATTTVPREAYVPTADAYTGPSKIVGYYTAWATYGRNYQVADIQAQKFTHMNYAFANIADGKCVLGDSYADTDKAFAGDTWDEGAKRGNFNQLNKLKEKFPNLRTEISVGGWTWSANFSKASETDASRKAFASSCVTFMKQYGFDGIDIDWEYPVSGGLQPGVASDKENYTLLMQELRKQLDAQGAADNRTYDLSIAAPAGPTTLRNLEISNLAKHIDWMNLMAYDFHGGWDAATGHNAALFTDTGDTMADYNVGAAVDSYLAAGMPAKKIVVGLALYGRGWQGVGSTNNGLHQAGVSAGVGTWEKGVFDYDDLVTNYLPTMTRYWDNNAKVPYLYDPARGLFISYDDAQSIKLKVDYVKSKNLGGVMVWETSGDRKGELLDVIVKNL